MFHRGSRPSACGPNGRAPGWVTSLFKRLWSKFRKIAWICAQSCEDIYVCVVTVTTQLDRSILPEVSEMEYRHGQSWLTHRLCLCAQFSTDRSPTYQIQFLALLLLNHGSSSDVICVICWGQAAADKGSKIKSNLSWVLPQSLEVGTGSSCGL